MTTTAPPSQTVGALEVRWTGSEVEVRSMRSLGAEAGATARRFLDRVFAVPEVASVRIDREQGVASIRPQSSDNSALFLRKLAEALRTEPAIRVVLPRAATASCMLHRSGDRVSTCEILVDRPGWLRLRHPRLKEDRLAARDCQRRIAVEPGVAHVQVEGRTGTLNVRSRNDLPASRLIRIVEDSLDGAGWWERESPSPPRASFALPNTNLAIGTAADLAVPVLGPVCVALLVGTNLKTFRQAWGQMRERKAGLPVLYTVIVGGTLVSGNFLASALMSWSFKYWQDRLRVDLSAGRRRLLSECLPLPSLVSVERSTGATLEPIDRLRPGDRVRLGPGDPVPADGRVLSGRGFVDQRAIRGLRGVSRVDAGDEILAGGRVLHGTLAMEIVRSSDRAKATAVGRTLLAATTPTPGATSSARNAEAFAERAVAPTIVAAGVGLLTGGLDVATAVLRPDYATGPSVTGSLEGLRNAADCAQIGVVIRSPEAFERLTRLDRLIIDDFPELHRRGVQVETVQSNLSEELLLRYAASAFRHLDDPRAAALDDACRDRGSVLLNLPPVGFDDGVAVVHGKHHVIVRDQGAAGIGGLAVEINGRNAGRISFTRSHVPAAARTIAHLKRRLGIPVTLLTHHSVSIASRLGRELGVDEALGGMTSSDKAAYVRDLRSRGRVAFVGDCAMHEEAANAASVSICTTGDLEPNRNRAAVVLMRPDLGLLSEAIVTARSHEDAGRSARRFVLVPGIMCAAGAMFFGVTSLAVVLVNHLGTHHLYRRAVDSLRSHGTTAPTHRWCTVAGSTEETSR